MNENDAELMGLMELIELMELDKNTTGRFSP